MSFEEQSRRIASVLASTRPKAAAESELKIVYHKVRSLQESVDKIILEMRVMSLRSAEIIDVTEFRRLMAMLASPDKENHILAQELIANLIRGI